MSFASRRELLAKVAPRYWEATRKQKTFCKSQVIFPLCWKVDFPFS